MGIHYIYIIQNKINNKIYVGQSNKPLDRWSKHKYAAKKKNSREYHYIHKAINKYGVDNFKFQIIDQAEDQDEINFLEEFWIQFFGTRNEQYGYNLRSGGDVSRHSEESKRKMSEIRKGIKFTEEHRQNISKSQLGKTLSDDTKEKISISLSGDKAPWYGKKMPDSAREKMRQNNLGKTLSDSTKIKMSENRRGDKNPQFNKEPANKTQLSLEQELEIVRKYSLNEFSQDSLKKEYKISLERIRNILIKNNIPIRKVGRKCKN